MQSAAAAENESDWIAHCHAFWTEHVDRLEQLLEKMDE
jgi:hypothetical protein